MSKWDTVGIYVFCLCVGSCAGMVATSAWIGEYKRERYSWVEYGRERSAEVARYKAEAARYKEEKQALEEVVHAIFKEVELPEEVLNVVFKVVEPPQEPPKIEKPQGPPKIVKPQVHATGGKRTGEILDGAFTYRNVSFIESAYWYPSCKVTGEITNNSGKFYIAASFNVSVYDEDGTLIDTGLCCISSFKKGHTRSFYTMLAVDVESVASYKIDSSHYRL